MKRVVLILAVLGAVAVAAALLWFASSLDGIVEDAIEQVGSELLGVPVRVGGVSIDLQQARGSIRGLRIANPSGADFSAGPAFSLDEISLELDLASIGDQPIVLKRLHVGKPEVFAEVRGGALNLDILRKNLASKSASDVDAPAASATAEPVRLRIQRFEFNKGALRADSGDPEAEIRELSLPSFLMRDVGGARGAEPGQIGKSILDGLLAHAAAAAARHEAKGAAENWIDEKLEDKPEAAEAAKKILDGLLGSDSDE